VLGSIDKKIQNLRIMRKIISYLALWLCAGLLVAGSTKDNEKEVTGTINGFVSDYANANAPIAGVISDAEVTEIYAA